MWFPRSAASTRQTDFNLTLSLDDIDWSCTLEDTMLLCSSLFLSQSL